MNATRSLLKTSLVAMFINPVLLDHGMEGTFSAFMNTANAQTYHFAASGDDTNGDGSLGSPWQSLETAQDMLGNGRTLRFNRGDVFHGQLLVTGLNGVTIEAYGTGNEPVFRGSEPIEDIDWVQDNGTTYRCPIELIGQEYVADVLWNGERMTLAREPNVGWLYTDASDPTSITDQAASGADWTNATAVIRSTNWGYAHRMITGHDGNELSLDAAPTGADIFDHTASGWGYFVQNLPTLLDAEGEWYSGPCPEGQCIFFRQPGGGPPTGVERIVATGTFPNQEHEGIYFNNCSNVTVQNIAFERYAEAGIQTWNSTGVTLTDLIFRNCFIGVKADQSPSAPAAHVIQNSVFEDLDDAGLRVAVDGCTIANNTFRNIGLVAGRGTPLPADGYMGLSSNGPNTVIEENSLEDIGYTGMIVTGNAVTVRKNHITRTLATLNDGGGILFDRTGYASYPTNGDYSNWQIPGPATGMLVEDNIVTNITGNFATVAPGYSEYRPISFGIYFDERPARGVTVQRNTVSGCEAGIHVDHTHGNNDNLIADNTLFNNRVQLSISDYSNWKTGTGFQNSLQGNGGNNHHPSYNNTYQGNILYALSDQQRSMTLLNVWSDAYTGTYGLVDFGSFSGNHYFHPFSPTPIHVGEKYTTDGANSFWMPRSLARWQELTGQDLNSQISPLDLPAADLIQSTGVVLQQDFGSAGSESGWETCTSRVTGVENMNGYALLSEGLFNCRWVRPTAGSTAGGTNYSLSMRIKAEEPTGLYVGIQLDATGELIGTGYIADASAAPITLFFTVPQGSTIRPMVRKADQIGQVHGVASGEVFGFGPDIWVDDIVLGSCSVNTAYPEQIAAEHILRYYDPLGDTSEPQNTTGSFTIPGDPGECWSDVYGNFYAAGDAMVLDEWASIVLFRMDVPLAPLTLTNGVYTVNGTETWTDHWNIDGNVEVPDGSTLIIDGAHIGFPTVGQTPASNITVEPGGTLILRNGAVLTSWQGCAEPPGMWGGVKVLGTGTTNGAGVIQMETGAKISDALTAIRCAEGAPGTIFGGDTQAGGIVIASDALFENNQYDIVTRPHTVVDPAIWGPSSFTNCTFKRTRELHDTQLPPGGRVNLMSSASTPFLTCTFRNTTGDHSGMGIHAIDTRIKVEGGEEPQARSRFHGLDFAILHSAFSPTTFAVVDRCDFTDNKRGLLLAGADNSIVTRCTFMVADKAVTELGVEGAYGAYLFGCSGFEVEENTFTGTGTDHPKVGLVLRNTGIADNMFYNNTFNGFADASERSCGTVIMGTNAMTDYSTGLRLKCNDYDPDAANDYDVAFTGNAVSIANEQGTDISEETSAGNTFAQVDPLTCNGNEARHLYEDVEGALNAFSYWHHLPQSTVELVPQCNNVPGSLQNTNWFYEKPVSCPIDLSGLVPIGDDATTADDAHTEHEVLVEVYDNWRDGGNTAGLIAFIQDPNNSSYAVRNQLMLVAPRVSAEAWSKVFNRTPPLNPWHLAQALLANSPLERTVLDMLDSSAVEPFYKELVLDGQHGGVSMHSIYKSEIAHFNGVKSGALQAMVRKSLRSGDSTELTLAAQALSNYPTTGLEGGIIALQVATGDLQAARVLVDDQLQNAGPDHHLWLVYDLWLEALEGNEKATELDSIGVAILQDIATAEDIGSAQAEAWLALLGTPVAEVVLLPNSTKRLKPQREYLATTTRPMLAVYPNPSSGPVYITYTVLEGVEQVEVQIHDAQGRLLRRQGVGNANGIIELPPKELASGLHVASLRFDGILVGTTKFNFVR